MEEQKQKTKKMYLVAVDMGYGHQRAAYPLISSSEGGIINANHYQGIRHWEKRSWQSGRKWYEIISRFKNVPIFGQVAFAIMDSMQKIEDFYPRRDLSANSQQQKYFYGKVKQGLGKTLIHELNKKPLPFVTTFFVPAYFAEYHGYRGPIYCIVCDADVARAWAPYEPKKSRIIYLVPNKRVRDRLQLYGVRPKNILVTGFPLPKENIGEHKSIAIADLKNRIYNLDPKSVYRNKYGQLIGDYLCPVKDITSPKRPLTITFAVGGAGAQRDLGVMILQRLRRHLKNNRLRLNLVAGVRDDVYLFFQSMVKSLRLESCDNVRLIYSEDKMSYFKTFNKLLRSTDILWTKPSELTFYCALGLPIIMSESIGYQERHNREWLLAIGAGIDSPDPRYVDEWLFDWLDSGWLAEAAMKGFMEAPHMGTSRIENIVLHNKISEIEEIHLL